METFGGSFRILAGGPIANPATIPFLIYIYIYLFMFWRQTGERGASLSSVSDRLPSNQSRAEIAVPQLGLPALVLDHITLRQQEREGVK